MTHAEQNFWRAKRLQHLADRALRMSNHCNALSSEADHHFRRYRKLLLATIAAWQEVDVSAHARHPLSRITA